MGKGKHKGKQLQVPVAEWTTKGVDKKGGKGRWKGHGRDQSHGMQGQHQVAPMTGEPEGEPDKAAIVRVPGKAKNMQDRRIDHDIQPDIENDYETRRIEAMQRHWWDHTGNGADLVPNQPSYHSTANGSYVHQIPITLEILMILSGRQYMV